MKGPQFFQAPKGRQQSTAEAHRSSITTDTSKSLASYPNIDVRTLYDTELASMLQSKSRNPTALIREVRPYSGWTMTQCLSKQKSQSHRTDQGSSDCFVIAILFAYSAFGRNPTVLIREVPNETARIANVIAAQKSQPHRTDQESSDRAISTHPERMPSRRNPTVLIREVRTHARRETAG